MLTGHFLNKFSLSLWFLILLLHIWFVISPIKSYSNFSYNSNNNTTFSDQIKPPQGVISLTSWLKCSSSEQSIMIWIYYIVLTRPKAQL